MKIVKIRLKQNSLYKLPLRVFCHFPTFNGQNYIYEIEIENEYSYEKLKNISVFFYFLRIFC